MPKSIYVYEDPTITTSARNDTPFGLYDADDTFHSESVEVCKYVARKMGHPVMQLEIPSSSIYACFEEATSDYSSHINNYNIRNWMWDHYGNSDRISGSMGTGSLNPIKPAGGSAIYLSDKYGTFANVGGDTTLHTGSITLERKQVYDIPTEASFSAAGHSDERLEIQTIFNYGPSAVTRFYDPFAGSFEQRNMLDNFGMGDVSPAVSFIMRPLHQDISRAQQIETNDRIRKSAYSFELINNKLRIFPIPKDADAGNKVYFHYYLRDEKTANSEAHTINKVSDPSNVPYQFITYSEINAAGRQWIRRYCLALSKELLGMVRSKYGTIPIPNSEVSLDGETLRAEATAEKETLIEQLREMLDQTSQRALLEADQEASEHLQSKLNKVPIPIYIG